MALVELAIIGLVLVTALVFIAFLVMGLKFAIKLLLNSLIGFFALWVTKVFVLNGLVINIWSVLLTAVFGIVGYIIVLVLHILGILF